MTPEEAEVKYKKEWPALDAAKRRAVASGDKAQAKRCRQALSALSDECSARFELRECDDTESADTGVREHLEAAVKTLGGTIYWEN